MTRNSRRGWLVATMLALTCSLLIVVASAQDRSLKEQVVGAWSLVSFESFDPAEMMVSSMEGGNLKGLLILTNNGLLSVQMMSEIPKLASKDRLKATAAEDKAVAHGVLHFLARTPSGKPINRTQ